MQSKKELLKRLDELIKKIEIIEAIILIQEEHIKELEAKYKLLENN